MKKKILKTALLGNAAALITVLILFLSSGLTVLTNAIYDFDMQLSMDRTYHHDIVVVGIDDESLKEIGAWPWDRKEHIPVIQKLEAAGAKVIGFDVMFNERGNPESDRLLAEELSRHKNIIFPYQAVFEGKFNDINNDATVKQKFSETKKAKGVTPPIESFAKVTHAAQINADLDRDGVIRKTFLQIETPRGTYSSLALKAFELAGGSKEPYLKKYPYDMNVRFDLLSEDIQYIPFAKVKNGSYNLKDRIVLVGFTAAGFENDDGKTPVESKSKLVYAHANIINQLFNDKHLAKENIQLTLALLLVLFAATVWLAWRLKPVVSIAAAFAIALIALVGQYFAFANSDMFINMVYPLFGLLAGYLTNLAVKTYFETKQKNYITKQFGRYISPELVKEIAASDKEIQLGGISRELTILFLDVRGFTPLSEKLEPEEVVGFLNMMFNLITERALVNHGTIDKFIGDAAMILFNAPLNVEHHPYYAVKTAFDIQKGMESVRQDILDKYGVTISVGIGINTGDVVVGNIGSYLRVDYTAIGDNVNTAARIESNTSPNQILVSEATYELTKDYFDYNYDGEKMMKGKSVPIKLYEVKGHIKAAAV